MNNAHRVFKKKRNFQALIFRHGRIYEPVVREKYIDVIKFHLSRNTDVREPGLVFQPKLFWLAASSDDLVSDMSNDNISKIGLIEIDCPKSKKSSKISGLVNDQSFYVKYEDRVPELKRDIIQTTTMHKYKGQ